jgi:hypothetical protein
MYVYLFVQAALEVVCVKVVPEEDMESLEISQTSDDSDEPLVASPRYR